MIPIRVGSSVAVAVVSLGLMLALAPAVAADPESDAVAQLRTASLYVDPAASAAGVKLDQSAATSALAGGAKIAVLSDRADNAIALAGRIGTDLGARPGNPLTVGVLTITPDGHGDFRAASARYCPGFADAQAQAAVSAHSEELRNGLNLTATILDFAKRIGDGPVDKGHCPTATQPSSPRHTGSGGSAWPWNGGIAAVGAVGVGALVLRNRRRRQRELEAALARVTPYNDRLAGDINTLDAKDDAHAQRALADAAERFTSAGSQLATADTVEDYAIARCTVLEGLYATRAAHLALGMDPGPELPPVDDSRREQLTEPQQVNVQGQQFQGYPGYTPGSPHYFGGGWGVPGGWYGVPFWETLLIGSMLSGGRYGGMFGGGYGGHGAGYDGGCDGGCDGGYEAGQDPGGGSSGGGDFGGGGFGGGDFGGGDFGGGDSGGGDSGGGDSRGGDGRW